jgi:hypothetical protein
LREQRLIAEAQARVAEAQVILQRDARLSPDQITLLHAAGRWRTHTDTHQQLYTSHKVVQNDSGFLSTEVKVPVPAIVATWFKLTNLRSSLFSFGFSIVSYGIGNCPHVWVPTLIAIGEIALRAAFL